MPISVTCPNCGTKLKAPDELAGKRAKCKKCETKFLVEGPTASAADAVGDTVGLSVSDSQALETVKNPFSFGGPVESGEADAVVPELVEPVSSDNPFAVSVAVADPNPTRASKGQLRKSSRKGLTPGGEGDSTPRGYQAKKGGGGGLKIMLGVVVGALVVGGGAAVYILTQDKPADQAKASTPPSKPDSVEPKEKPGKKSASAKKTESGDEPEAEKAKPLNLGGGATTKRDAAMPNAPQPRPGVRVNGPAIPAAPKGDTVLAKVEAYVAVPGPADKIRKIVINRAGSMGISLYRSFDGFGGMGALDTCERFALPSGAPAGKFEIPADGVSGSRSVALAQDGSKLAIEHAGGKVGVWDLNEEGKKEPLAEFEPFAKEKGKPVPLAAIYFLDEAHLVVVGAQGQLTGFDCAKKEKTIEGPPVVNAPDSLMAGKNVTITPDGKMVVMVGNGKLMEIPTSNGRALAGNTIFTRPVNVLALATDPAAARVLVCTEDESSLRVAMFPIGADKPKASFVYPSGVGKAVRANWIGNDIVTISTSDNPGCLVFDGENGRWTSFVHRPGPADSKNILFSQDPEKDWHVTSDGGKLHLVAVEWPFDSYFAERDLSAKGVMSFSLGKDGLKK